MGSWRANLPLGARQLRTWRAPTDNTLNPPWHNGLIDEEGWHNGLVDEEGWWGDMRPWGRYFAEWWVLNDVQPAHMQPGTLFGGFWSALCHPAAPALLQHLTAIVINFWELCNADCVWSVHGRRMTVIPTVCLSTQAVCRGC